MRAVAIITGPQTHLDHLGVLSSLLEIPLIVTEHETYQLALQFYPDFQIACLEPVDLSMDFLAQNFDVIFETGKFFALELAPFMELLFRKKMRFVFCPHGNSDKGHSLQDHVDQDISLVYGDHLFDHLTRTGAATKIGQILRTGNYRYAYYLQHRARLDALTDSLIFQKFEAPRKTLLYAPTWQDGENASTFFFATDAIIEQLSPHFNILIKLHPLLVDASPAQAHAVMRRYEGHPCIQFLTDFPAIYPLLARCDAYLGDYSSIGYDFLIFDRPMYFLHPTGAPSTSPLRHCGIEIPMESLDQLGNRVADTFEESKKRFSEERRCTYAYAFDADASLESLKELLQSTELSISSQ
ncbi:MAG: CDP-glycerol glycerophosphotransferase family protein [Chlamydiota bacterium]